MTKQEFGLQMKKLSNTFKGRFAFDPNDSKEVKADVLETWYEFLGEFEACDFQNAVSEWILNEDAPPTVRMLKQATSRQKWRREGYNV